MRAKFKCESVTKLNWGTLEKPVPVEEIKLSAVMGNNPEDNSFANATPTGALSMLITNPAALGYFKPAGKYYINFTEAPE